MELLFKYLIVQKRFQYRQILLVSNIPELLPEIMLHAFVMLVGHPRCVSITFTLDTKADSCSQQPVIISAAWESSRHGSTLARHEWKGLSKMTNSLQDWEEKRRQEQAETAESGSATRRSSRIQQQRLRRLLMPGMYFSVDDDDDEEM